MPNLGDMKVRIVGDNSEFDSAVDKSKNRFETLGKDLTKTGKKLTTFVTLPLLGIAAAAVKAAADMEMQQAAFETMLGSAAKARDMLRDLTDLAARTPFQLTDLGNATKTMLAFGIAAEDVIPTVKMLGDIAQGNAQKLDSITLAFSQIQSTGRLMGQDLLQLINAGFNPLQVISEQTGETMAELKKRMEQGGISAQEVAEAFKIATSEGGRFFGGMERASQTLTGQFSTLKDNVVATARSFGDVMLPTIKAVVGRMTDLTKKFTDLDPRTKRIVINFAAFAAAAGPLVLIVGKTVTMVSALKTAMVALNLTMAANPVLIIVSGLAALVAIAAVVIKSTGLMRTANQRYAEDLRDATEAVKELSLEEQKRARAAYIAQQIENEKFLAESKKVLIEQEKALQEAQEKSRDAIARRDTSAAISLGKLDTAYRESAKTVAMLTERNQLLTGAIEELDASIGDLEAMEERERLQQELLDTQEKEAAALAEQAEALAELKTAQDALAESQKTLPEKLAIIRNRWAALGDEVDAQKEIAAAYRTEIENLIEAGLDPESEAVQTLVAQYEALKNTEIATAEETTAAVVEAEETKVEAFHRRRQEEAEEEQYLTELKRAELEKQRADYEAYNLWLRQMSNDTFWARKAEDELWETAVAESIDRTKQKWADYAATVKQITSDLTSALTAFYSALYDRQVQWIEDNVEDEVERDKEIRRLRRNEAIMNKTVGAFNVVISTAEAIIKFLAQGNPVLSVAAGITGALQLAAILAEPLPALAAGGIVPATPGGRPVIVGEGGSPEAVVPLDEIGRFLSSLPGGGAGAGGDTRVVVNLDGQPIIDTIAKASRDRTIIIDSRSVVA